jgi:hypothetical protein
MGASDLVAEKDLAKARHRKAVGNEAPWVDWPQSGLPTWRTGSEPEPLAGWWYFLALLEQRSSDLCNSDPGT